MAATAPRLPPAPARRLQLQPPPLPEVRVVPWQVVAAQLDATWNPDAPHISIWGQTRVAGKSHLIRYGLTPLLTRDRVLVIDTKGGDATWAGWGQPITRLRPSMFRRENPDKPRSGWYHLIVPRGVAQGRPVAAEAMERVFTEGDWVIVFDEGRSITDPRPPFLGLKAPVEEILTMGGGRGIMAVHGTQAPRYCAGSAYSECAHSMTGRTTDTEVQKRLREIAGYRRELDPVIAALKRRQVLYLGDGGDSLYVSQAPPK